MYSAFSITFAIMMYLNLTDRINACAKLGDILRNPDIKVLHSFRNEIAELNDLIENSSNSNGWFTSENVRYAIHSIGTSLRPIKVEKWLNEYPEDFFEPKIPKVIGVVMAGNLPLAGFYDYLSVVITGNRFLGKLSSNDTKLLPLIHRIFEKVEPGFKNMAEFTEERLENFDAIIATGSNNTSRYFEYYFGKYPHIIRKNRNSVAVITGEETPEDFTAIGEDIFRYYGLGCRNVSKLYVPNDFAFDKFLDRLNGFSDVVLNHKYNNNYDYNKSIFLVNSIQHFDTGFLLLTHDQGLASPVSVLYYEKYENLEKLKSELKNISDQIQCVVSLDRSFESSVLPGQSQKPELWDYADGIDVVRFLIEQK